MAQRDALIAELGAAVTALTGSGEVTYTEMSIGAIAAQAGISRPTFYASFADKNALLSALAQIAVRDLAAVVDDRADIRSRAALDDGVGRIVDAYRPHRAVFAALGEVAAFDPAIRTWYHGAVEAAARRFARHMERRRTRHVDPESTARWLVWTAERGLRRIHAGRAMAKPASVRSLADLLWHTVYAR